jgi:hypothetical protein
MIILPRTAVILLRPVQLITDYDPIIPRHIT